jgi:hypothetical protein
MVNPLVDSWTVSDWRKELSHPWDLRMASWRWEVVVSMLSFILRFQTFSTGVCCFFKSRDFYGGELWVGFYFCVEQRPDREVEDEDFSVR